MKRKKKISILLSIIIFILCGCNSTTIESTNNSLEAGNKSGNGWVIFVYMCGSDLESTQGSGTDDLQEMLSLDNMGDNLTFVIETGGASEWNNDMISADMNQRFEIKNGEINQVDEVESRNMGKAETLADFVLWGTKKYSGSKTGLIFWNHGGGSINGVCFDENYNGDSLTIQEIDNALGNSLEYKLDFIGFDACLMSSLETANMTKNYADYMIASEETEPGNGWDYEAIVDSVNSNGDISAVELGKSICDNFYESCEETLEEDVATLSVVDLSKIDDINDALEKAAKEMNEASSDISALGNIAKGIKKTENYGGNAPDEGYTNMVDLGDLFTNISNEVSGAKKVVEAVENSVVYMISGESRTYAHGISIYYPLQVQGSEELSIFESICGSDSYSTFVNMMVYGSTYGNIDDYNSDDDLDWSYADDNDSSGNFENTSESLVTIEKDIYLDEDNYYNINLSKDSLDYVESVQNILFADWYGDGYYYYLGNDNNVNVDWKNGVLTDNFWESWPALPNGQLLMYYVIEEKDDYTVYSSPIKLNGKDTNLRFLYNYDTESYEVIGTWDGIDDESGVSAKEVYKLKSGDKIEPYYTLYNVDTDDTDEITGEAYTVDNKFIIEDYILPEGDYYYGFEIIDIFGLSTFSDYGYYYVDEEGEIYIE